MKIQVVTYGISRLAGGVFGAVCGLFTNRCFDNEVIDIISFEDEMAEMDRSAWGNFVILCNPFLLNQERRKAA